MSPAPTVLPGRAFQQVDPRSNLLFHWRASDMALTNVSRDSTGVFSRASAGGLVLDVNGQLSGPAADGMPRFELVALNAGSTRNTVALRLEGARTNSQLNSNEPSTNIAGWIDAGITAGAASIQAPDGSADLLVLSPTTANSQHNVQSQVSVAAGVSDDTIQPWSFWLKFDGVTNLAMRTTNKALVTDFTNFKADGTIPNSGHTGAGEGATMEARDDGWYECTLSFDSSTGGDNGIFIFYLSDRDDASAPSYAGSTSDKLYLWGVQMEKDGVFASTPIPTAGSAVTRAAETLYFPFSADPQAMTVYVKIPGWVGGLISGTLFHIGAANGAADPRLVLSVTAAGALQVTYDDGTTVAATGAVAAPTAGHTIEALVTLTAAGVVDLAVSANGGALTNVASAAGGAVADIAAWAAARVYLNSAGTGTIGFAPYHSVKIAPGVKSIGFMRGAF